MVGEQAGLDALHARGRARQQSALASEECLGIMALMIRHGTIIVDHETGEPAGNLEPFVRSGLLDREKQLPLSELQSLTNDWLCLELAFMGHNIALTLQAMGLGGLYFTGLDSLSVLGAHARDGVAGLGFRFVEDERWVTANPIGLEDVYEALCPPNYADMHAAVEAFVGRKFGPDGAYAPNDLGPWRDSASVKGSVVPYSSEFVDCLSEVARYIYDKYGKFPGTRSTIMLPGFVQAITSIRISTIRTSRRCLFADTRGPCKTMARRRVKHPLPTS